MERHPLTTAMTLHATQVSRSSGMMRDTARLAMTAPGPNTFTETADLTRATMDRAKVMQASWMAEWEDWLDYTKALAGADTVPKFMEHSGNILLRAQAQMLAQMTDLSGLAENLSVSYGYWVNKQLSDR